MFDLLAQAGGGGITITNVLVMVLGSSVLVALLDWVRNRGKDEATRKSIEDEVNKNVWDRAQVELSRAYKELDALRAELEQERGFRGILEGRVREMEHRAADEQSVQYRALLEAIPEAVIQAGQYGLIKSVNAAAMRLFGYERDEMVGQPVDSLMPERYKAAHRAGYTKALRTGTGPLLESVAPTRLNALHADGHEFQVALKLSKQGQCFTAVVHPYLDRYGTALDLVDFPEGAR